MQVIRNFSLAQSRTDRPKVDREDAATAAGGLAASNDSRLKSFLSPSSKRKLSSSANITTGRSTTSSTASSAHAESVPPRRQRAAGGGDGALLLSPISEKREPERESQGLFEASSLQERPAVTEQMQTAAVKIHGLSKQAADDLRNGKRDITDILDDILNEEEENDELLDQEISLDMTSFSTETSFHAVVTAESSGGVGYDTAGNMVHSFASYITFLVNMPTRVGSFCID